MRVPPDISKLSPYKWCTSSTTTSSYIKININIDNSDNSKSVMLAFTVTLYQGYRATKIFISGYNYGSNNWYQPEAYVIADTDAIGAINVYFGYNATGNLWVAFNKGNYTGIVIDDIADGYVELSDSDYNNLFSISEVSSLSTQQATVVAMGVIGSNAHHPMDCNNVIWNGMAYYTANGPATSLGATATDGALYSQAYNENWVGQIAQDYRNGNLFVRGKNSGTWQSWKRVRRTDESPTMTDETYPALLPQNGSNNWIKIGTTNTNYGILPSQGGQYNNGHNYIGTSTWYWAYAYITNLYAYSTTKPSSRKLKKNIEDMTEEEANKLFNLRPVKYDYKVDKDGTNCYGLIAEEVKEIGIDYPVMEYKETDMDSGRQKDVDEIIDSEKMYGLDYTRFIPYLIKVCQMQQKEINELKKEIKEIKDEICSNSGK